MLAYDAFGPNIAAHLLYARSLSAEHALEAFERRLSDGTWQLEAVTWLGLLGSLVSEHELVRDSRILEMRGRLVEKLVSTKVGQTAHLVLRDFFQSDLHPSPAEAATLASWFEATATPGDASLAADLLETVHRHPGWELIEPMRPLAAWLVMNGAAELRSRRRGRLLLDLLHHFDQLASDRPLLLALFRYIVLSDENEQFPQYVANGPDSLLRALERALESDPTLPVVGQLAAKLGLGLVERVLDPQRHGLDYPATRHALLRALIQGIWPRELAEAAWRGAFWASCPAHALAFVRGEDLELAMKAFKRHGSFHSHGQTQPGRAPEHDAAWARFLVSEFARIHGIDTGVSKAGRAALNGCCGTVDARHGVADAILNCVKSDQLPFELLSIGRSPALVAAAIAALPDAGASMGSTRTLDHDAVRTALTRILHHPWGGPIYGLDLERLMPGATQVHLADWVDDDKVRIEDGSVLLHCASVESIVKRLDGLRLGSEAELALVCMYFVHELAHVAQNIGDKRFVQALRSTGAEATLMHADLGADHVAALAVAEAFPKWRLDWLKDLQGKSLIAFPAESQNTAAGRARKAYRLVGLRLDHVLRLEGAAAELEGGYAFADFGPAGGHILALANCPPFKVVRSASLSPTDAGLLAGSAEDGLDEARLRQVDRILRAVIGAKT